jgi:hypothetical protein
LTRRIRRKPLRKRLSCAVSTIGGVIGGGTGLQYSSLRDPGDDDVSESIE